MALDLPEYAAKPHDTMLACHQSMAQLRNERYCYADAFSFRYAAGAPRGEVASASDATVGLRPNRWTV
jgi:hypothetical protein